MNDVGKIIKQGSFYNKMCGDGTITLRKDRIQLYCPRGKTSFQFMFSEINSFRISKKGLYVNNFYIRIDNKNEWIKAILQALDSIGIRYEATGYRMIQR
jgi:hypothetical protein